MQGLTRTRLTLLPTLLLASLLWPALPADAADTPPCMPAGATSSEIFAPGTALPFAGYQEFHCTVEAGVHYRFELDFDSANVLPGDAVNYIGIELYRENHVGVPYSLLNSVHNLNDRETVDRTATEDETWYIKVHNTASSSTYSTDFGLLGVLPGGGEGT